MYYPQKGTGAICGLFGKTRQAWYKQQWAADKDTLHTSIIIKLVKEIRQQMPRIGTRKLHYMLAEKLERHGISIGRDKLFDLLSSYGLLVRRRRRKRVYTTDSQHHFKRYPNLIKELTVQRPNHLWVSDITYIGLPDGFCYLSLVTDAYSRKITGFCLHPTLKRDGPVAALQMAIASLPANLQQPLIHHSDRGIQYCCAQYVALLENKTMTISMTENGDPYENAIAERVNGILKNEFELDRDFNSFDEAANAVDTAISTYNDLRPHASCDYLTPGTAHNKHGVLPLRWAPKKKKEVVMST